MEASGNWQYFYRIIENLTDNITLAHPLKTRIIGEAKIKTDKIDSKVLAYMLKADMLPACYIPSRSAIKKQNTSKIKNITCKNENTNKK